MRRWADFRVQGLPPDCHGWPIFHIPPRGMYQRPGPSNYFWKGRSSLQEFVFLLAKSGFKVPHNPCLEVSPVVPLAVVHVKRLTSDPK